ncbi:Histone deacetylase hda1 [Rhizina undulata]
MVTNGSMAMDSAMTEHPTAAELSSSSSNFNINPPIIPTFTSADNLTVSAQASSVNKKMTGLCYDHRMTFHQTLPGIVGNTDHPEDAQRIIAIYNALFVEGLVEESKEGLDTSFGLMTRIIAREATREDILLVHGEEHWTFLESTEDMDADALKEISSRGDSVFYNQSTFLSAKVSCGAAIEACQAVVTGAVENSIAVIRPPGHHAEECKAMGFSMFNNVAVAARVMQKEYPDKCRKILILDWDIHHGNGTQWTFYDDPSILYISIHRYGEGFYPGGTAGDYRMCGEGDGLGMNVNVPWPQGGMGDLEYAYAFQKVVMPIALEFSPDLVIISAGFDAATGDTIGDCCVTPAGYAYMTQMMMKLAEGKVVVCLEGGYNLQQISDSVVAVTKVLMQAPPAEMLQNKVPSQIAVDVVYKCALEQSQFWRCLSKRRQFSPGDKDVWKIDGLNDVIRHHQACVLNFYYEITPLPILRKIRSPTFEAQVVATPNFHRADTIIYIIHDPPTDIRISPDSQNFEYPICDDDPYRNDHISAAYVHWAVEAGFGVIDVNIPRDLTGSELIGNMQPMKYDVTKQAEELCTYMWDNYLELTDATKIFFIGVGEAYEGLVHLLSHRDCRQRVRGCVNFVDDYSLRAFPARHCVINPQMHKWYYANSLVVVNKGHHALGPGKGLSTRFGCIIESSSEDFNDVLDTSYDPVTDWIWDRV